MAITNTLLVVTGGRLIRADYLVGSGAPELINVWDAMAPAGETLPVLAEAAFLLGPAQKTQVFLLATLVVPQVLSVPSNKVAGLQGAELANALSFEAEMVSAINPFDSALGERAVGGGGAERQYWVTQMSAADLTALRDSLALKGAVLRAVAHPGGLPRRIGGELSGPWQRLELWHELVVALDSGATGSVKTHVMGVPASRMTWQTEADHWFGQGTAGAERVVLGADAGQLAYSTIPGLSLEDEGVRRVWLSEWMAEFQLDEPRVPLIRPAPKPMADSQRWAIAAAITIGAAGLCGAHALFLNFREKSLRVQLEAAEKPARQFAQFKARADQLQKEIDERRRRITELRDLRVFWKDTVNKEHRRHATLLASLATGTPPELAISTIDENGGEMRLSALSILPQVEGFGTNLATAIEGFGWRIEPPRRRALGLTVDGGPWVLEWMMRPGMERLAVVQTNAPSGETHALLDAAAGAAAATGLLPGKIGE